MHSNSRHKNQNLSQIFIDCSKRFDGRPALGYKNKSLAQFVSISWNDWVKSVEKTAHGLRALGVKKGDRVAILSENRPEWTYADLAILSLGAVVVPIYPTLAPKEIKYIAEHSGATILFTSTADQISKLCGDQPAEIARFHQVITFEPVNVPTVISSLSLQALWETGAKEKYPHLDELANAVDPKELATIIYTSGTTGPPKGVMLTHSNFVENYLGAHGRIKIDQTDVALSFLPLCHVFERLAGYYFMAFHGAQIVYAESMLTVPDDIKVVRPTVCAAVPRFYEKVHARVLEKVSQAPAKTQKIFNWAMQTGTCLVRKKLACQSIPVGEAVQYALAKVLVLNKIKKQLGGRIRFFISGGAPLNRELAEFFYAAGVLILEGYGLTETSPVIAVNTAEEFQFGTVGKLLPNVEVEIAADGEIITRGPCVMAGYYENPEATREVIRDGWFHTGDIGEITAEGFLKITDRKKDIIVTSGGKNVSPQNIEGTILRDPAFSQVVLIGDKRNYLVALIVPNRAELLKYAASQDLSSLTMQELVGHPKVYAWYEEKLRDLMRDFAPYEQIKYFALLPNELSMDNGELTPTLKVKRRFVMQKYADIIEGLYLKGRQFQR